MMVAGTPSPGSQLHAKKGKKMLKDNQILQGVQWYRDSVWGRHGPPTLEDLATFMKEAGITARDITRQALHYRVHRLVQRGLLASTEIGEQLFTAGLYVTDLGRSVLEDDGPE